MKKISLILISLFFIGGLYAQEPVEWTFFTKKLTDGSYEVHLSATIDKGWFICSQYSSKKGSSPTEIKVTQGENVKLSGKFEEVGALQKRKGAEDNVRLQVFENQVEFVSKASVRDHQKGSLQGTISFVASDGAQTLPQKTVNFSVSLN
jgi:thiol:disulfide interchange protein DsbD